MLDVEALRLCVLRVVVLPVCDEDGVVRDTAIAQVLRLRRALVAETKEDDLLALEDRQIGVGVVVAASSSQYRTHCSL